VFTGVSGLYINLHLPPTSGSIKNKKDRKKKKETTGAKI